jgi:exodeoxyribonuclease VIII
MDNGIYEGMKDSEYFGIDMPSSTSTKSLIGRTNMHLAHDRENPREETDAFTVGAMVHALVLAPLSIEDNFIRAGKIDRRTKEGKAEYEGLLKRAALRGARIISEDQSALAHSMADAVMNNTTWSRIDSLASRYETVVIGEICGRPAKCKIDAASDDFSLVYDLKTTQSASASEFSRSAAVFGYAHQAAFYRRVLQSVGTDLMDFVFVCVEKDAPHAVACYRLSDAAIESADRNIDGLVERWWAVQEGNRDGFPDEVMDIDIPAWAYTKNERIA